jgi:hypothetical protein
MSIDELELSLCGYWKKTGANEFFGFLPAPYAGVPDFKYGVQFVNGKTFEIGYKVYEKDGKPILFIVDREFHVKKIDRRAKPSVLTLADDLRNEATYEETSDFPINNKVV